jgi:hypothetical protein
MSCVGSMCRPELRVPDQPVLHTVYRFKML